MPSSWWTGRAGISRRNLCGIIQPMCAGGGECPTQKFTVDSNILRACVQGSELRLTGLVGTPLWRSEDSFVHRKGAVMEQNRATIASLSHGITSTSDQPGLSFAVLLTWIRCLGDVPEVLDIVCDERVGAAIDGRPE